MGTLAIIDSTGDTKIDWDANKPFEIEQARKKFNEALKGGGKAFRVNHFGDKTKDEIKEFDPDAEHIVIVKPLVGG